MNWILYASQRLVECRLLGCDSQLELADFAGIELKNFGPDSELDRLFIGRIGADANAGRRHIKTQHMLPVADIEAETFQPRGQAWV